MDTHVILVIIALLLFADEVKSQNVKIDFTSDPAANLMEGLQILLSCQVSGPFDDTTDTLVVKKTGEVVTTLATEDGKDPGAPANVLFVGWIPNNGAYILYLSISNISRADKGNYTCAAYRQNNLLLARQTVTVDIMYSPRGNPQCEAASSASNFTWYDGDEITLKCTADAGNPVVPVDWYRAGGTSTTIPKPEVQVLSDSIISLLRITLNTDFNGVIFSCVRQFDTNSENKPESCYLGPLTVLNSTTQTPVTMTSGTSTKSTGLPISVIATIVIVASIFAIVIIVIILFKFGKCKQICKISTLKSHENHTSLAFTKGDEKVAANDHSFDNPVHVEDVHSPNGGGRYAVVQNNKLKIDAPSSGNNYKIYPDPPAYPRPPKNRESTEGEQYANTSTLLKKPVNDNQDALVQNMPKEEAVASEKSKTKSSNSETVVYGNSFNIGGVPQLPTTEPKTANDDSKSALYANTADVIAGTSHHAAPEEAPPSPPDESNNIRMSHTPGLEYADLDLVRPASTGTTRDSIISNESPVVYASLQ